MRTGFITLGIILNIFFAITLWMFLSSDSGKKIERYSLNFFLGQKAGILGNSITEMKARECAYLHNANSIILLIL